MTVNEVAYSQLHAAQAALSAITMFSITDSHFPTPASVNDGDTFDFVVIGSGAGGSTVSSRLSENANVSVLLIEAGKLPPFEASLLGMFPWLTDTEYDWQMKTTKNSVINPYLQNYEIGMIAGKMLGGTSAIDHGFRNMPNEWNMDRIAKAAGDESYKLKEMLKYFIKSETLTDENILEKYPSQHGTNGPLIVTKHHSDINIDILASFGELNISLPLDINADTTVGYIEPLLLRNCAWRQSSAESYLGLAKNRTNLYMLPNTLATKILIDSSNIATGVQIQTSDGNYKTINVRKEVVVSCGAIKTPQLLMLSGIGHKKHLEEFGIEVKADLPVGDNFIDHFSGLMAVTLPKLNKSDVTDTADFPVPVTTGFISLNRTKTPDYQPIHLYFERNSSKLVLICATLFKLDNSICEDFHNANLESAILVNVVNYLYPETRGTVRLNCREPTANPKVDMGYSTDSNDYKVLAQSLQDVSRVVDTSFFKNMGSEVVKFNIPECNGLEGLDYWICHAKNMRVVAWHYIGSSAVGNVLDNTMMVKGFTNIRVVDASSIPTPSSGKPIALIYAFAEKAADLIKDKWNLN